MAEVRQCWAYNRKQQRCEHPAGHPGNHVVSSEWSDDECVVPVAVSPPPAPPQIPLPEPVEMDAAKCVACGHKHKSGECKCGCHSFIG